MNEHRKNCEREGKLDQATLARKRLKELRIFEEEKRKEETFNRHVSSNDLYSIIKMNQSLNFYMFVERITPVT